MWVVYEYGTGWSSEDMRFATVQEAGEWIADSGDTWLYSIRYED